MIDSLLGAGYEMALTLGLAEEDLSDNDLMYLGMFACRMFDE
jgi:hypothetical protein